MTIACEIYLSIQKAFFLTCDLRATVGIQLYNKFIISETAGLLPARYFEQRYKPDWDVRENLFEHQKSQKYSNDWSINAIEDGYQSDQPYSFNTEPGE